MKLLSDPFQVDPTRAAVNYQIERTDIQNERDLNRASCSLSFDSGLVMFHQTVTQSVAGCQEFNCCVW